MSQKFKTKTFGKAELIRLQTADLNNGKQPRISDLLFSQASSKRNTSNDNDREINGTTGSGRIINAMDTSSSSFISRGIVLLKLNI